MTDVTPNHILQKLQTKLSTFDARMVLDSVMVISDVKVDWNQQLRKEEAQTLCMQLMRRGGPAFQVGTEVYKYILQ